MPTTWQHHGTRLLDFIPFTLVIPIMVYPSLHTYRYDWTKTLWLDAGRCPGRWTDVRRTLKNTFPLTSTWPRSLLDDHLGLVMRAKLLHMHHVRLFTGCISLVRALCFPVPQRPAQLTVRAADATQQFFFGSLAAPFATTTGGKPLPPDFDGQKPLDLCLSLILCRASWYDTRALVSTESFASSLQIHSQTAAQRWTSESRASAVSTSSSSCDT